MDEPLPPTNRWTCGTIQPYVEIHAEENTGRRKRDWDRMLPYVLFATETLGLSPFELLYGCDIRAPLDVLREEWIQKPETDKDILTYIMEVKDRMETARENVEKNAKIAQTKQKEYYDQKARQLNLQAGDKVLLLLPSSTKKLVAQ